MSIDRGMDKEDVVYMYSGILLRHKKEWNNAICSSVDGPRHYHTEWSHTETKIIYHLYVESRKLMQINLFIKQNRLRLWKQT